MAQQYINRTNRALSFARSQLKSLELLQSSEGWSQDMQVAALEAAICFHLTVVLHAYRREIAERYNLPTEAIETLDDLVQIQQQQGQTTAETTEFEVLKEHKSSWLNQLEQRYLECWAMSPSPTKTSDVSASEISLVQIEPGRTQAAQLPLSILYSEIYALIDRQRNAMQEW